jgi:hypothetical protein
MPVLGVLGLRRSYTNSESSMPDVRKEGINRRNGETEEEGGKSENLDFFSLASVLPSPPFLRSSCSLSSDLGNDDPELV